MEQPSYTEPEVETKHLKSEADVGGESNACNGAAEEEPRKGSLKRKLSPQETDENDKKYVKLEDHGGGDIPAHHARRPPNGFLLFCKRHRDIVSAKNPNLENRGVTKLLGNWWRTLEEEERGKYKDLARKNKEIFIANNPQFTWYKLPAPPLRTLVTRPSNRRPPKLETSPINSAGPITPGKLADESQLGGLTNLLSSSVSPPSTPFNASPPSPTSTAPAHPKKRFLLQTRAKQSDAGHSLSESDEASDGSKAAYRSGKKSYKKKKNWNSLKYKRNLKMKWSDSFSGKVSPDEESGRGMMGHWKGDGNDSPNCTQQQLIEKIVDSTFDSQKPLPSFDIQRKLDYITTEHTYQKNPGRFWQQKQRAGRKEPCPPLQIPDKMDGMEQNIISPNVNNNTIVITEAESCVKKGLNEMNYSYNGTKLISDYVDSNQRQLDQSSIQTNHDRITTNNIGDGYIPEKYARRVLEDCDKTRGSEDQNKPLKATQDDDIPKNCDRESNFQSILGKVSREIGNMINERSPESTEEMAVAKFNIQSRSDSDSDESYDDKSDTASPPESPGGGRRSKRSCKGQRYEQFIKDSVSKKRGKSSDFFGVAVEYRKSKKKRDLLNPSSDELEIVASCERDKKGGSVAEAGDREQVGNDSLENAKDESEEGSNQIPEDLNMKEGTKPSEIIKIKLDEESKLKRESDEKTSKRQKDSKMKMKKKPMSKVQMIKERRELHMGEFNLNEKIEELPLLSFESFLQKKRQRKKRLLGLRKDGLKNRATKNSVDKYKNRESRSAAVNDGNLVPGKGTGYGQNPSKPDFTDLTTLAETALTLLSLSEPRNLVNEGK